MAARTMHLLCATLLLCACARAGSPAHRADDPEAVPGLVDVELRGVTPEHRRAAAALGEVLSDDVVHDDEWDDIAGDAASEELIVLRTEPSRAAAALAALRARPDVLYAEPVVRVHALWEPNDPDYRKQWHLVAAGAPRAWEAGRGEGVIVAVLDTGISPVDDLDRARILPGYDFADDRAGGDDDHGHGTHVAGTVAQATDNGRGVAGMAPRAKLLPLKVLRADGTGTSAAIARAIRYAVDRGARVLNLSLGGGGRSEAVSRAIAYARRKGALVVCAAGNGGTRGVSYPAADPAALAVSAAGPRGALAPYSSFGPEVRLAAPGGDKSLGEQWGILQQTIDPATGQGVYRFFQGTSMAAPHVAGAAALLFGVGVTAPAAVERLLARTARDPDEAEMEGAARGERYGAGLLDAGAALRTATLWWSLLRMVAAAGGALVALAHARRVGQLRPRELVPKSFWIALLVGAGAVSAAAPFGLARAGPLGALALPPAALGSHFFGLPGTSAGATLAAYAGWSGLLPFACALASRARRRVRPLASALRAAAAGFAFGWAGMLLQAAFARSVHLPWLPAALVPLWLGLWAVFAWASGRGLLAPEGPR